MTTEQQAAMPQFQEDQLAEWFLGFFQRGVMAPKWQDKPTVAGTYILRYRGQSPHSYNLWCIDDLDVTEHWNVDRYYGPIPMEEDE